MADTSSIQNNLSVGGANRRVLPTWSSVTNGLKGPPDPSERITNNEISSLQFPADLPKFHTNIGIADYRRDSIMSVGSLKTSQYVYLPLPVQLNDTQIVQWVEHEVGIQNAPAFNAGMSIANRDGAGALGNAAGATALGIAKGALSVGTNASAGGAAAAAAFGGIEKAVSEGVQGFGAGAGLALNQFVVVIMKGPTYKKFNFTWRLAPRNAREAEQIRRIIMTLNNAMAPGVSFGNYVFTYPQIIQMQFSPNENYLFKFKPSVITSINFNFSPGGVNSFYHDDPITQNTSAPESVDITMQTMELEYWLHGQFNTEGT